MARVGIEKRLCVALWMAGLCLAQNEPAQEAGAAARPGRYYNLEFVVKEVDGAKVLNARSYSMTVSTNEKAYPAKTRSGSRVPTPTGGETFKQQFQYIDVGVNIDCSAVKPVNSTGAELSQSARRIALVVSAEVSNVPVEAERPHPQLPPVVRQTRWDGEVVVPIGKPTIIFSSDDVASTRKMQLELTAMSIE